MTFFRRRVGRGHWPKRRMRLLIFLGCKRMENPNFWGRAWHPVGHLGIFFFLTSVFIFCNLRSLVMWVVEAIFWKMGTFISVQIWFKTKNWSWRSMNNNDVDVKYVENKLFLESFACRPELELLHFLHKIYSNFWPLSSGFMWY